MASARDFHGRCDGHAPTLTLILDTKGNIFGGFTPVKWESLDPHTCNTCKGDPSRKSFIFTLKNPHHVPARKFALKAESENEAINCSSQWGPIFADLAVCDNCGKCDASEAFYFGSCYTNDTGLDDETFFTGSRTFTVKEIEVFEISD